MRFSKDFPEKLRSQILVSEVVGKTVRLKLRGKEHMGLCPFHNEKSPSFTVNDQKGFYHCFGCQEHGDIISFVMKTQSLDYADAVKQLADEFGIEIPQIKFDQVKEEKIDRTYLLLEKICNFFEERLQEGMGREAKSYLERRGIDKNAVKKFRLGYAPSSYESLHKYLQGLGFSENELLQSGVIAKNDQGKLYDKFRNRAIFTITDKKNRPLAFGGRVMGDEFPKYLNSAETPIFKKNQTLYNLFYARKAIFDKKYAVIVEGYMDTISLSINGIENVVAALGTALGENHIKELFTITDKIVICLDGDSAGIRAAQRVSEIVLPLVTSKKNIHFTFLPSNLDPDDYIKNFGAKALEDNLNNSLSLSKALIEFALNELNLSKKTATAEDKARLEAILMKKVEIIKDNALKKYFLQYFKDFLYNFGRAQNNEFGKKNLKNGQKTLKNDQNNLNFANFGNLSQKLTLQKPLINQADILAKNIIALMIIFPALAHHIDENFDIKEVNFLSDEVTQIKDAAIEYIEENPSFLKEKLIMALEKTGFDNHIKDIKNLLAKLEDNAVELDESTASRKMTLLLLKELLLQTDQQYKQLLLKIEEIETYPATIITQKVKEIFAYKYALEQRILELEKD